MLKVAVVGSRNFSNKAVVEEFVVFMPECCVEIVSGRSPGGGPDVWAEETALKCGIKTKIFPIKKDEGEYLQKWEFADRAKDRNTEIAQYADVVVAFWDGKSRGTMDTVDKATRLFKPVFVISEIGYPAPTANAIIRQWAQERAYRN
jgi:hypothetical protein